MAWMALFKAISLGYLTGLASLSFAALLWTRLSPRIVPAQRADTAFGVISGVFLLNGALTALIWAGVISGHIIMTTPYFHHLMYGGWSLAITAAGILLLCISALLGYLHWKRGRVPRASDAATIIADSDVLMLRDSNDVATISLVGAWKPELWINPQYWASLSRAEQQMALHHESLHLARRDTLRLLCLQFIAGLFAILPWVRRWTEQIEADGELAVDDRCRVELHEGEYVKLVVRATEHSLAWRSPLVASHLAQRHHAERLRVLSAPRRRGSVLASVLVGYAAVLLSILPAAALLFNPLSRCLCACYLGY